MRKPFPGQSLKHLTAEAAFISLILTSILLGIVVGLSQPLLTAIAFGLIATIILLVAPLASLWLTTVLTLLVAGPVQYFLPNVGARFDWAAYLVAGSLFLPALAGYTKQTAPTKNRRLATSHVPTALLVFTLVSLLSTIINAGPAFEIVVAIKSLVLFGGLWAFLLGATYDDFTLKKWLACIMAIGLIQWLPAIYQYVFVRSKRLAAGIGDTTEASDAIVGTFPGSQIEGGGLSSVLALFLVVLLAALLAAHRERQLGRFRLLILSSLLAIPLLLTEVKAVFVYVPIAFAIVYWQKIRSNPASFIAYFVTMACTCTALLFAYDRIHWSEKSQSLSMRIEKVFGYSFEEKQDGLQQRLGYMTRREVVTYWARHGARDPLTLLIGHGIGSSRTQGLALGHAARPHYPAHIDLTGLSLLLWETGVVGALAVLLMLSSGFWLARTLARELVDPFKRTIATTLQAAFALFIVSIPYRNDIPYAAPMMFLVMASYGLLGWLNKLTTRNT